MLNAVHNQNSNQQFVGLAPSNASASGTRDANTISAIGNGDSISKVPATNAGLDDFSPEGLRASIDLAKARIIQGLAPPAHGKLFSPTNDSPFHADGKMNVGQTFQSLQEDRFCKRSFECGSAITDFSAFGLTPVAAVDNPAERFSGFIQPNIYISSRALSPAERARLFAGSWSRPAWAGRSASTNDVTLSQVNLQDVPARSTSDGAIGVTVFAHEQSAVVGERARAGLNGASQRPSVMPIQPNAAPCASTDHRNNNLSSHFVSRLPLSTLRATPLAEPKLSTSESTWLPASVIVSSPEASATTIFSPGPDLDGAVMSGGCTEEYLMDVVLPDDEGSASQPIDMAHRFPSLLKTILPLAITGPPFLGEEDSASHSLGPSIFNSPSIHDVDLVSYKMDGLMIFNVDEEAPPKAVEALQVKPQTKKSASPPPTPPPSIPLPPLPRPKQAKKSAGGTRQGRKGAQVNTAPPKKHRVSSEEWLETAISGSQDYEQKRRLGGSSGAGGAMPRATRRTRAMRRRVSWRISTTFDYPKASGRRLDPIAEVDETNPVSNYSGERMFLRTRVDRHRQPPASASMTCQSSTRSRRGVCIPPGTGGGHIRNQGVSLIPTRTARSKASGNGNIFKRASKKLLRLL